MIIDTSTWGWPQWIMLILLLLSLGIHFARHGQQQLETDGPHKGEPVRYNGFGALFRFCLLMFLMVAGGFFA